MVVYDTGSDWLTVKACFTKSHCNEEIDKEATIKKMTEAVANMSGEGQPSQNIKKTHKNKMAVLSKKDRLEKMMDALSPDEGDDDPDNDGDGVMKPLSNPSKDKKKKKMEPIKSPDAVYFSNTSMRGYTTEQIAFPLSYGSAELSGFKMKDTVCLSPIDYGNLA